MEAYCVNFRTSIELVDSTEQPMPKSRFAIEGTYQLCGARVVQIGMPNSDLPLEY